MTRRGLVKKLDAVFSEWTRARHANPDGLVMCVTCRKYRPAKEMHAGHFVSRRHMATRWEPRNVNPQCAGCNTFRAGEQYLHGKYIDETHGPGTADELVNLSRTICKWTAKELQDEIKRFQSLIGAFA